MNTKSVHIKSFVAIIIIAFVSNSFISCKKGYEKPVKIPDTSNNLNVIFILGDDVGYEVPTCDGGQSYSTPNIDFMAANGVLFTQAHAAPLCSPSRFMLLTGKYNFRNYTNWGNMDLGQKTIGNMFADAGYKTAVYGKWQLGGGAISIHTFGFQQYCVWDPLSTDKGSRYKDPDIYENGNFVQSSLTKNKYGEDIFTDSVLNFIQKNASKPFFIYYPMVLTHAPFCPTPDDPEFAGWNADHDNSNPKFFPSMTKYMDKKIGMILDKLKSLGLDKNTIVVYAGDNGTSMQIKSKFKDTVVTGGKTQTNEFGTHVPLIIYSASSTMHGAVVNDLIDFTDFLPTLAGLIDIKKPNDYGPLDGVSFSPRVYGEAGTPRNWIFYYYDPFPGSSTPVRWVQDTNYKLYDNPPDFYNIRTDVKERFPLEINSLTDYEKDIRATFLQVLADEHR